MSNLHENSCTGAAMKSDELFELLSRAESHLKAGRPKQAKSAYRRILSIHPKSTEAHFQMAILLHDENDPEGAVRHFQDHFHHALVPP